MPDKTTKALSSAGIVGLILSIFEAAVMTPWAFSVSHQNLDTDLESVEYATASATPAMRRWIGGRKGQQLFAQSITLKSEDYEDTLQDKVKNWMYDKTGLLQRRLSRFVEKATDHWNKLATEALELGETTLTYDGVAFFSASHVTGKSGTLKNLLTNSEVASLNVADTANVTVAEAAAIINGLLQHFQTFKDDHGEPLHEGLSSMIVMVPVAMSSSFKQAVTQQTIADGSGSRTNNLVGGDLQITIVTNARLTSSTKLYAFANNGDPALILQQRGPVEPSAQAEGSALEFNDNEWAFGLKAERAVGLFCWQGALKATIS